MTQYSPHLVMASASAVAACKTQATARRSFGMIETRMADMRMICWPALEQSWQQELEAAARVMAERGWA